MKCTDIFILLTNTYCICIRYITVFCCIFPLLTEFLGWPRFSEWHRFQCKVVQHTVCALCCVLTSQSQVSVHPRLYPLSPPPPPHSDLSAVRVLVWRMYTLWSHSSIQLTYPSPHLFAPTPTSMVRKLNIYSQRVSSAWYIIGSYSHPAAELVSLTTGVYACYPVSL